MEEYKKIARRILVPSFFSLLPACSVIFLIYSYLFASAVRTAAGIACFAVSLLALFLYARNSSHNVSRILVPLLISFIILIRILLLIRFTPIRDADTRFSAVVKSVKALRYSNEILINFFDPDDTKSGFFFMPNTAVSYLDKDIKINQGDELALYAKPKEIKIDNRNISSFETVLLRKGLHYIFYLNGKNFKITRESPAGLKDKIRNLIEDNLCKLFDERTVPVLKGLYFANDSYIDKSTRIDFKRAGVLHILAASGEHIGIIAGALLIIFSSLLINRKLVRIIIALILLFYLYITDMPVSLLRAFVMYYIFSFQYIFDFDKNILNTLFLSAIVLLIMHPYELYNIGFQLSFGATFGIIVFFNFYNKTFSFLPAGISKIFSATFSAQALIFPVIYAQLKEINLTGLLSNVILIFTMSVALIFSLIANIVSIISVHTAKYLAIITDISYSISLRVIQYLSSTNGHFMIGSNNYFLLLPYLLFLLPLLPVKINRKIMVLSVIASVICAWFILSPNYSTNRNKIVLLDSDNKIVIILKENYDPVLFGTLSNIEDAEIIAKYLNVNNIRNINICIPVPDFNNLKNYTYLIKKTLVSRCFISPDFMFTGFFKKFCQTIDADGIKLRIIEFKENNFGKFLAGNNPENIKNIFISPFDNITRIYNLFTKDYDSKNIVMEGITNIGYEIEYL